LDVLEISRIDQIKIIGHARRAVQIPRDPADNDELHVPTGQRGEHLLELRDDHDAPCFRDALRCAAPRHWIMAAAALCSFFNRCQ
jgi:hypothetical protein